MPERDTTRTNDRIRVPEVRVIGDDGSQVGVMRIEDALKFAQERDLDLVEVAPDSRPPVCRVLDYSKYKYEQAQKVKAAKKHQTQITIREIKFRPKIGKHDYETKKGHVIRFLLQKNKVKVTIMFRGREVTHPERGTMILDRLAEELAEIAQIEQRPNLDGRNMTMMLGPSKAVVAGTVDKSQYLAATKASAPDGAADEDLADDAAEDAGEATAQAEAPAADDAVEGAAEGTAQADEAATDDAPEGAAEGTAQADEAATPAE